MRSYGSPKRKCASITSSPLFASVAESIVIFAPIVQVGCASASLGRHVGELVARAAAERPAARGQDERSPARRAARTGRAPSARCRPGSARLRPARARASARSPAATRLSLFASASVTPCSSAHIVAGSPAKPSVGVQDDVRLGALEQLGRIAADLGQRREPVDRRRAGGRGDELELRVRRRSPRSPGGRSSRSRRAGRPASCRTVCPRSDGSRRDRRPGSRSTRPGRRRGTRRGGRACRRGRRGACRVSLTPMSRFSSDSKRSPSGAAIASTTPSTIDCADRQEVLLVERDERDEDRRGRPEDEPLPRLAGRGARRHLVPAEQPAAEVRERVAGPDGEQHGDDARAGRGRAARAAGSGSRGRRRSRARPCTVPLIAIVAACRASEIAFRTNASAKRRRAARRASSRRRRAPRRRARAPRRCSRPARAARAAARSASTRAARPPRANATSANSHQPPRYTAPSTTGSSASGDRRSRDQTACSSAAESSTPRRVLRQGRAQVALVEVGPELVDEDELRVGELPEQEVRDAQLAARADQQIGIGQLGRVEVRGEDVLVDLRRRRRRSRRCRRAASTSSARPP